MDTLAPMRVGTAEFTLNVGPHARVEVQTYRGGTPYLVINDGSAEVLIKPHEDVPIEDTRRFFEDLAEVARTYADDLAEAARAEANGLPTDR